MLHWDYHHATLGSSPVNVHYYHEISTRLWVLDPYVIPFQISDISMQSLRDCGC
jgi:hypothetical protein